MIQKSVKLLITIFACTLFLTGCDFFDNLAETQEHLGKILQTNSGMIAEQVLPEQTAMLVSINTQDVKQRDAMDTLLSYFQSPDQKENMFIQELNGALAEYNLKYEKDIIPVIGKYSRMTFSLGFLRRLERKAGREFETMSKSSLF